MASISRRPRRDGGTAWRVQFRETPGAIPTTETFETYDDAAHFSALVDRIGGRAARQKRDLAGTGRTQGPTLHSSSTHPTTSTRAHPRHPHVLCPPVSGCPASSSWQDFGLGKVGDGRVRQPAVDL